MKSTRLLPRLIAIAVITCVVLLFVHFSPDQLPLVTSLRALPEVASVEMLNEPQSQCALIHVRQTHSYPIKGVESDDEQKERLHLVQKEMYSIATFLHTNLQVNAFYTEGVTPENLPEQRQMIAEWKEAEELSAKVKEFQKASDILENLSRTLHSGLGLKAPQRERKDRALQGEKFTELVTTCKLVAEQGMELRPAETKALNDEGVHALLEAAIKAVRQGDFADILRVSKDDPRIFDNREYELLRILARDYGRADITNRTALLFFGGKHDWTDNVQKWNGTNTFKFSLITVTPRTLALQ